MKKEKLTQVLVVAALIFLTALCRLITNELQMWNFTAVGASALFAGVTIRDKRYAYAIPLFTLFLTDLFFEFFTNIKGFYGIGMLFVYGAFLLITLIGTQLKKVNALSIFFTAVGSGLLFFFITNFGVWAAGNYYPHTFDGLMTCLAAGVPFYKNDLFGSFFLNTIMGHVFYSAILFGAYALIKRYAFNQHQLA